MTAAKASSRIVTERLALREFRADDLATLYRLNADPRVMRYIGDGSVATQASAAAALERSMKYYGTYPGLGVWPAESRGTGEFVWY